MTKSNERRTDNLQTDCKAISVRAMLSVQRLCGPNETEFQYAMTLVIHHMADHLGLSLAARKTKEEIQG